MSFIETYIENPKGRSAIISLIISAIFFLIAFWIPFQPYDENVWYSFLYKDLTLKASERFNYLLVGIDVLVFVLFYFHLTVALGNLADVRNTLPGWTEVIFAFVATMALAIFQPKFGTNATLAGGNNNLGYNHFTSDMQVAVGWFTLLGVVLVTLYFMYTSDE